MYLDFTLLYVLVLAVAVLAVVRAGHMLFGFFGAVRGRVRRMRA
jgi:hypothetical protein